MHASTNSDQRMKRWIANGIPTTVIVSSKTMPSSVTIPLSNGRSRRNTRQYACPASMWRLVSISSKMTATAAVAITDANTLPTPPIRMAMKAVTAPCRPSSAISGATLVRWKITHWIPAAIKLTGTNIAPTAAKVGRLRVYRRAAAPKI